MPPFIMNIPNLITIFRILTIPMCTLPLLFGEPSVRTLIFVNVIFVVGAATDFVDGWLARRLNQTSDWGAYMDPLIDKFLIWALYFVFVLVLHVPWWTFLVILGRDLAVTQMRNYALKHNIQFKTSFIAKLKTASQMIIGEIVLLLILFQKMNSADYTNIASILIQIVAVFTLVTGVDYGWTLYKNVQNNNNNKK